MELAEIRRELPVCEQVAYLNAGTFGPLPRRTVAAMRAAEERDLAEGRCGKAFFEGVLAQREELRAMLAHLIGAPAGSVALTSSTTEACNIVLNGLGLGPGDEVVTTDSEHPGLFGGLVTSGADIRVAAIRDRPSEEALAAIEEELTGRTRLVAVSHVSWLTGALLPVRELSDRGVPLLVDGAQGAGAIPVDVQALGCDYYTVSGQKWLLGPDATGCLYVAPGRVEELRMAAPSYFSWQQPDYVPKEGALRFESGWTPPAAVAGLLEALRFAEEVGGQRFSHARAAAARCREVLAARGVELVKSAGEGTLVSFAWEDTEALVGRLAERGVVVRDLPGTGWVRASCGFWTSEDDLDRLAGGI